MNNTSKQKIEAIIAKALKDNFSMKDLEKVNIKLRSGELEGVFWNSIKKAIQSKQADAFQDNADIPGDFGTHQYHDIG